jgi:hypothetical protein
MTWKYHTDPEEITKFGNWLSTTYGVSVATHQGSKVHDHLRMIFNFTKKGMVAINMIEYIKNIIFDFLEEITAIRASLVADHLFTVWDPTEAKPLPEEQAHVFHHVTTRLLFLSVKAQHDIQPVTAFLMTRVKSFNKDNWSKVKRLLGYLKGTINMPLILLADSLTLSGGWWANAAYAIHHDCKGHMGAGMSFGQGMALS